MIPCLLLRNAGLVKTIRFKSPAYVGDPINTVRIYNDKEVDELILLDITATPEKKKPQFKLIAEIASECFMPFVYGGGIRCLEDIEFLFALGAEKIALNTYAHENPAFIEDAARRYGSQSVIVSIDARRDWFGRYQVYSHSGAKPVGMDPVRCAQRAEQLGAGEILLTSMDRDGTFEGYDVDLLKRVTAAVAVPVIACGGAGRIADFGIAVREGGAAAVAAGSMVVYQGKHRAVLTNFPSKVELKKVLG